MKNRIMLMHVRQNARDKLDWMKRKKAWSEDRSEFRKGIGYKQCDGCWNCKHRFTKSEYDEGSTLYCTFGAEPRPPCGSVLMGELNGCLGRGGLFNKHHAKWAMDAEDRASHDRYLAWDLWSDPREVHREGKCAHWEEGDERDTNS